VAKPIRNPAKSWLSTDKDSLPKLSRGPVIGANLARAEIQEALAYLPRRLGPIELDGEPEFGSVNGIYQLERVPLRFG